MIDWFCFFFTTFQPSVLFVQIIFPSGPISKYWTAIIHCKTIVNFAKFDNDPWYTVNWSFHNLENQLNGFLLIWIISEYPCFQGRCNCNMNGVSRLKKEILLKTFVSRYLTFYMMTSSLRYTCKRTLAKHRKHSYTLNRVAPFYWSAICPNPLTKMKFWILVQLFQFLIISPQWFPSDIFVFQNKKNKTERLTALFDQKIRLWFYLTTVHSIRYFMCP